MAALRIAFGVIFTIAAICFWIAAFWHLDGDPPQWWAHLWRAMWAGWFQRRDWYTARGWRYLWCGRLMAVCALVAFCL